ncbi:hypothetical protein HYT74_03515 [Candidatus Daviesbacteria bacterium]|nr:hypothetical protein [Candidatus Daviesbacteria bacterium]
MQNTHENLSGGYFLVRTDNPSYHPDGPIFTVKTANRVLMSISLDHPDAFSLIWETPISADEFLTQACKLIDALAGKPHNYRPMETGKSEAVIELTPEGGTETLAVAPSYSDYGYNNVTIIPHPEVPFDQLQWPLTIANIAQVYLANGVLAKNLPFSDDATWLRINGEFCTLFYGDIQDQWYPRRFSYWSHIPAVAEIYQAYQATAISPVPRTTFTQALEKTIALRFPLE